MPKSGGWRFPPASIQSSIDSGRVPGRRHIRINKKQCRSLRESQYLDESSTVESRIPRLPEFQELASTTASVAEPVAHALGTKNAALPRRTADQHTSQICRPLRRFLLLH